MTTFSEWQLGQQGRINGLAHMDRSRLAVTLQHPALHPAQARDSPSLHVEDDHPLTTILGWAQALRRRQFDEATVTHALETIDRSAQAH